jgi:serine/threonine-protein kinase
MQTALQTSFLQRLEESRLLTEEQIRAATAAVGPEEPFLSRHLVRQGLLTRYQARQLRETAAKFHVDKYVVVDFLGRGAHSMVYKARHTLLPNRFVALKAFDASNLHCAEEIIARFRCEVEMVARLDHPNIVRAYDVVLRRRQLYLVLEYIDGCDLAKMVNQFGPLPVADACSYVVQAAQGLAYAHRSGIVHRDIKPANLLLARDGVVKVADLGLAQFSAAGSPADAGDGLNRGTPEFMAPEQAKDSSQVDARSDLYSLGATLYQLLTGDLPVKGNSYLQRLQKLLTTPPRPLLDARPEAPAALAAIVDRLRATDPAARPNSAEEVIALLEPFGHQRTPDGDPRTWDGRRKAALVLEVMYGRLTVAEACAPHGLLEEEFERWQQRFLEGGAQALDGAAPVQNVDEEALRGLYAKIGAQAMEIERLKARG